MSKFEDLSGKKFNKLTAMKAVGCKGHQTMWLCKCECGNETEVAKGNLLNGHTKSCGCLKHQESKNKTHGKCNNRLYYIWRDMLNRCYNENVPDYPNYGGRGIAVCDEWKNDFQAFYDWMMSQGYEIGAIRGKYTLDRINVDDNYCPSNCRLVNTKEQQNNRRNNILVEYNGKSYTLAQLSDLTGIKYGTLHKRIQILKWSVKRAVEKGGE